MSLQLLFFVAVTLLLSAAAAQTQTPYSDCAASVSLDSTQPGHASYMYHDILVQNTGVCDITKVFVSITLPPYAQAFAYYNVSNQTGELFGLTDPLVQGSIEVGGTIVLNSARTPIVSVGSVECDLLCNGPATRQTPAPSSTIKIETEWGSNPWWLAIVLKNEDAVTSEVRLTDASGVNGQLMKREKWTSQGTFSFTPYSAQLSLPISLELTSVDGDKIVLKNVITTFTYGIVDTVALRPLTVKRYANSEVNNTSEDEIKLFVHPASTSHHVALTPYGSLAANVTNIYLKSQTTNWELMQYTSVGFYELTSAPDSEFVLPISVKVVVDGSVLVFDNAVEFQTAE